MATRKSKPEAAPAGKPTAARGTVRTAAQPAAMAAPAVGNVQHLLREAAWSRMFGRTESKNPFAR